MNVFIVRPFGTQAGIDFDRVERDLIRPVLDELQYAGGTTGEIVRAGNIRLDMFEQLLLADLVIADISIHNANVYYELGVRHALRDRRTVLLRARIQEVPFDLKTDRYLEYPADDPAAARASLRETIRQTVVSDVCDSPVYLLLPELKPRDPAEFRPVPPAFREAVLRAERAGEAGLVGLLGEEISDLHWDIQGRRCVGRSQFRMRRFRDARATWEAIRAERRDDVEANLALATIDQRQGDLAGAAASIERVTANGILTTRERAEARALAASNLKARWIAAWRALPETDRPRAALRSPLLHQALTAYHEAFLEDLDHYYSGINALALHTIVLDLARRVPAAWEVRFATEAEAGGALQTLQAQCARLAGTVAVSLHAAEHRARGEPEPDVWLRLSQAEFHLLTSDRPEFVADRYQEARELGEAIDAKAASPTFSADSAARQIRLLLELGILVESSHAALRGLGAPEAESASGTMQPGNPRPRVIVFTGHRVDEPGRAKPRFPADQEGVAREAILAAVKNEVALADGADVTGVAGGACGGDILFHEVCFELKVPTVMLLAVPRDKFAAQSVQGAGPAWMERFRRLCNRLPTRILNDTQELPDWLRQKPDYDIWNRNNLWTLHQALAKEEADATLIALWNGEGGDGPGGTRDMIELARKRGMRTVILDTRKLFGLSG